MTLRHLEIFYAVAKKGSFTKAAEQLYITQSAVSHAIKELEEQADTCLFERMPKSVRLTECGRMLLSEVAPILASYDKLQARVRNMELEAPIHIVSSITIASYWLPQRLKQMQELWPEISVEVFVVRAKKAIELLLNGEVDLAFIEGAPPFGKYHSIPFASYRLLAVCAKDYPIKKGTVTLEELGKERLLLREKGSAIRDTFDSLLYLHGLEAHPIWTSVNSPALIEAAKAGLGITVMPDLLVAGELEKGSLIEAPIEGLDLKNDLFVVLHKEKYISKALQRFLTMILPQEEGNGFLK